MSGLKAIQYIRWSSEKQSKGSSFDRQVGAIRKFSSEMGWSIVEEHADEGESGWTGANMTTGALAKLRHRFRRDGGHGYVLVAENIDRLSRLETIAVLKFFIEMTETGLTVAIASDAMIVDERSLANQEAQIKKIVDEAQRARAESDRKSKVLRGSWEAMREDGTKVHTNSTCPAWLTLSPDRREFAINAGKADIVREIFNLYIAGNSKRTIARILNERKVQPFRGAKNGWQGTAVVALLKSRAVIGEYQHRSRSLDEVIGDPIPDYFPAIITNEVFQEANSVRTNMAQTGRGREIGYRNLFADLAHCAHCGSKMRFNRKPDKNDARGRRYLQCSNYDLRRGCTHSKMYRAEPVEELVLDRILPLALDDQYFRDDDLTPVLAARLADLKREMEGINQRLDNVMEDIARRPSDRIRALRDKLETQEDELAQEIAAVEADLAAARGRVEPAEHLRRVAEIRADMWSEDEARGLQARKTVKLALNDIVQDVRFSSKGEGRQTVFLAKGTRILLLSGGQVTDIDFKMDAEGLDRLEVDDRKVMEEYLRRSPQSRHAA